MKMWGITNTKLMRSENQNAYAVFEADAFHAVTDFRARIIAS